MKKMNDQASRLFGALGLRHLQDERGLMLVLTMVILLVLSSLAATNIINAYLDRSLARNQHYASVSLNAADAGLDYGLTWLNENGDCVPDETVAPFDTNPSKIWADADLAAGCTATLPTTGTLASGGDYTLTFRFKTEDEFYFDADGSNGEIVLYNSCANTTDGCWGFQNSIYDDAADPARPLIELESVGTYESAGSRTVTLNLARNGFEVKAYGAVTAASNVNTTGNIDIDGRAHDETGALCPAYGGGGSCSCGDAYPGITTDDGLPGSDNVTYSGSANSDGDPAADSTISSIGGGTLSVPTDADDALGLPVGSLASMFSGAPAAGATKVNGNITWINANYNWSLSGTTTGIIIVSNPNFNAASWRVSVPFIPDPDGGGNQIPNPNLDPLDPAGNYDPLLNAGYDNTKDPHAQTDPYVQTIMPRNIDQQGNGTHKGVVIADSIDKINGNCTIIGAMISLSTMSVNTLGNGAAAIKYSCDAINLHTLQSYSTKLAWRRKFN